MYKLTTPLHEGPHVDRGASHVRGLSYLVYKVLHTKHDSIVIHCSNRALNLPLLLQLSSWFILLLDHLCLLLVQPRPLCVCIYGYIFQRNIIIRTSDKDIRILLLFLIGSNGWIVLSSFDFYILAIEICHLSPCKSFGIKIFENNSIESILILMSSKLSLVVFLNDLEPNLKGIILICMSTTYQICPDIS